MSATAQPTTISAPVAALLVVVCLVLLAVIVVLSGDEPSYICARHPEVVASSVCVTTP